MADHCTAAELPALVQELPNRSVHLFAGVNGSTLRELLDAMYEHPGFEGARPVLFLEPPQAHQTEKIIADVTNQLAEGAFSLWPLWFGGEDFSELTDSALSHQYLPIKLAALTSDFPCLSAGWAEAAISKILRRQSPRVPGVALETEWFQLCHAINPTGLVVVLEMEASPQHALAVVHGFEWLAANGNATIVVLCPDLPPSKPPFDRLLYGARSVMPDFLRPAQTCAAEREPVGPKVVETPDVMLVLPPVNGRPHPLSLIEQRLSKMIEADGELRAKFIFNTRIEDVSLKSPKVDLLWAEGRLVIELDGAEHRGRRAYRDDRHRDYELLCAGYAVVRISNDEVVEDFARTLEKIRAIVRLRRLLSGGGR